MFHCVFRFVYSLATTFLIIIVATGCGSNGDAGGVDGGTEGLDTGTGDAKPLLDAALPDAAGESDVELPLECARDQRASGGVCLECPPGTFNAAGDDPAMGDTACEPNICLAGERVMDNACVACPPGTVNEEGADASGPDTQCSAIMCVQNTYVAGNTCIECPPGTSNIAGDDASAGNTTCDGEACPSNQHVVDHACMSCAPGTTNTAGDDASGANTSCEAVLCGEGEYVSNNVCVSCAPGATNAAGDDASGADTTCAAVLCAAKEYVSNNACVSCAPGTTNAAGDDATGADTTCEETCLVALGVTCAEFEEAYVKASNTDAEDSFGYSVALEGDTLVVGARNEASNATGVNGIQSNNNIRGSGAVYIFTRSAGAWSQEAYIKASTVGHGDFFGSSVALDGATLAVGAPGAAAAVYVFTRSAGTWSQEAIIKASITDFGDFFGSSVALDGDTLTIAAPGEDSNATGVNGNQSNNSANSSGAVYVFTRSAGTWSQEAYLKASNTGISDFFGWTVALDGDTLAVGAIYEASNATGVNGIESDNSVTDSGAVYIFTRSAGAWSQEAYLKASNTGISDRFGWTVALDGDTLAVGAPGEDSNATGVNGNQSNNSAWESGAVYIFNRSAGAWSQEAYIKASNTDALDDFGWAVALDGDTLAVGARDEASSATGVNGDESSNFFGTQYSGAAYLFIRSAGAWSQKAYVKPSNTDHSDRFGTRIALDGATLAVVALGEDSNATGVNGNESNNSARESGAVYVRKIAP